MTIQELLQIAGQQGKVVITDEQGELKAVLLSGDEYKNLAQMPSAKQSVESEAEKINREILQAQLEEVMGLPSQPLFEPAERIGDVLSRRAGDLFKSNPIDHPQVNPYNHFSAPEISSMDPLPAQPETDEEIKPNFDDI